MTKAQTGANLADFEKDFSPGANSRKGKSHSDRLSSRLKRKRDDLDRAKATPCLKTVGPVQEADAPTRATATPP
jgi:hypothetical protein